MWESVGYTTNGEADDWGWGVAAAVSLIIEELGRLLAATFARVAHCQGVWCLPSAIRGLVSRPDAAD